MIFCVLAYATITNVIAEDAGSSSADFDLQELMLFMAYEQHLHKLQKHPYYDDENCEVCVTSGVDLCLMSPKDSRQRL